MAVLFMFFSGCGVVTPQHVAWRDLTVDLVWPSPPQKERVRYLRTITGAKDFKKPEGGGKAWRWLLGDDKFDIPLLTPTAVVSDGQGIVWVADSSSQLLYKIDLTREKVEYFQEFNGLKLRLPSGLAFDDKNKHTYLSDAILKKVLVVNGDGEGAGTLEPPGGFKRPAGMTVDKAGFLYVADVLDGSIVIFDNLGNFIKKIYSKVEEGERFQRPVDVAVSKEGKIVVLDAASFRLEVQSSDGNFIRTIGKIGDAPGNFARPKGVAVNELGHIFVTDAAFDNIQVFDMTGRLLIYWGQAGIQPGSFSLPAGVFVDSQNRLFVADSYNSRIQVYQVP